MRKHWIIAVAAVLLWNGAGAVQAMEERHFSKNMELRGELVEEMESSSLYLAIDEAEYLADEQTRQTERAPYIRDGRTYVPLSLVEEAFGVPITWNLQDYSAIMMWKGSALRISLPENKIYYKGQEMADAAADVVPGKGIAIPLAEVLAILEIPYQWIGENSALFIYQKAQGLWKTEEIPQRIVTEDRFTEEFLRFLQEQAAQSEWEKNQPLLELAKSRLGMRYVSGATGPNAFDCSGFVHWVLTNSGAASYTRGSSQALFALCEVISADQLRVGDLIFFTRTYSAGVPVTHSAIYIGDGQMIHAAGSRVQITPLSDGYWANHFYAYGRLRK